MLQAPINLGCGSSCGCGCSKKSMGCGCCGGMGAADDVPLNATERVLYDYVVAKMERGETFFISKDLNSTVLSMGDEFNGMGFWAAIVAAIATVATKVGAVAVKLAPTAAKVAQVAATIPSSATKTQVSAVQVPASSTDAATIAAQITPQVQAALAAQGVTLPNEVAQPAVKASLLDAFGANNRPWVIAAGLALVALLVLR